MTHRLTIWHGTGIATTYAIAVYFVFLGEIVGPTLSLAFCCVVPLALGALVALTAPRWIKESDGYRLIYSVVMPWIPTTILLLIGAQVVGEAYVCVLMAAPFFYVLASVGGVLSMLKTVDQAPVDKQYILGGVMLLPLMFGFFESRFLERRDSFDTVDSQILIAADADAIWDQMVAVPAISREEWGKPLYSRIGLPQPIEATLDQHERGGVREAVYENGMHLHEPITIWEPGERLSFTVSVDPSSPKPYMMEGGAAFDVEQVTFWLEPVADGTMLHLSSDYRLTTPFNTYGQWWVNLLLKDLQDNILDVIKGRAEPA